MDDDLLDEIFTNNERNEECLRVMLELWLQKSMNPTWKAVTDALSKIGKKTTELLCHVYNIQFQFRLHGQSLGSALESVSNLLLNWSKCRHAQLKRWLSLLPLVRVNYHVQVQQYHQSASFLLVTSNCPESSQAYHYF